MNYITDEMKRAYGLDADAISSSIKIKKHLMKKIMTLLKQNLQRLKPFQKIQEKQTLS